VVVRNLAVVACLALVGSGSPVAAVAPPATSASATALHRERLVALRERAAGIKARAHRKWWNPPVCLVSTVDGLPYRGVPMCRPPAFGYARASLLGEIVDAVRDWFTDSYAAWTDAGE